MLGEGSWGDFGNGLYNDVSTPTKVVYNENKYIDIRLGSASACADSLQITTFTAGDITINIKASNGLTTASAGPEAPIKGGQKVVNDLSRKASKLWNRYK